MHSPALAPRPTTNKHADSHINGEWDDNAIANTNQMMGDGLTTNPKDAGQYSPSSETGSSITDRHLIISRGDNVPLPNKKDQEIESAINRALFHHQALGHIRMMNAKRDFKGAMMAITHLNRSAGTACWNRDIIVTPVRSIDYGVVCVEHNETLEQLKMPGEPLVGYIRKGTEGLDKIREECKVENDGLVIPTHVSWLAIPCTICKRRQNSEIVALSVVFVVNGCKVATCLKKKDITGVGVLYQVERSKNAGPHSRCELFCGWGHIENMCGNKGKCGYCSDNHRTSDHQCNELWCMANQGLLHGHTLQKCLNFKRNHVIRRSSYAKNSERPNVAWQNNIW
jgi:hypothetical protein